MTRQRGDNGRYVESSSGFRNVTKSFRITAAHAEKLDQIVRDRGLSLADLIEPWVENDCSVSACPDLQLLKKQVLSKFQRTEKIGVQSSAYKKAEIVIDLLIDALRTSN